LPNPILPTFVENDNNLEMMAAADAIFMDGTFKISPPQFTQLFTLHIIYMEFFIPVVYALLKDKSSNTYYQMFATLRREMATCNLILHPLTLVLDFESSILPSLRQHFMNSIIKGCNFHFTQEVWRKIHVIGEGDCGISL
jgi:hypothetical protein